MQGKICELIGSEGDLGIVDEDIWHVAIADAHLLLIILDDPGVRLTARPPSQDDRRRGLNPQNGPVFPGLSQKAGLLMVVIEAVVTVVESNLLVV